MIIQIEVNYKAAIFPKQHLDLNIGPKWYTYSCSDHYW